LKQGSQECVRRECPVDSVFDYEHHQVIVRHGQDRFAAPLPTVYRLFEEYDRWVDLLHARDDARATDRATHD
jgi:hypothetical protein